MSKHTVRLATVMALLLVFSQIASAASPFIPVKSKPMKSYGVFLPAAVELDDKELAEIEGEGLVAGVLGAVAGAVTGAISYTVGYTGGTRTVDVHVRRLRQKLNDDPNDPYFIETVHGVGYRWKEETDA
jgi:hypothetical protein